MQVLITGGAGFIGSHLAEAMLERGRCVTAVDNLSTGSLRNIEHLNGNKNFRFVYETVMNETVMDRLVSECDIIFHLAAAVGVQLIVKDPVWTLETNLQGTEMVLKMARRYRKKVIIASTSEVYGKNGSEEFRENDDRVYGPTTKSRWCYAESKVIDEFLSFAYHKQFGLPIVICRFFNTVGPRQTGSYGMVIPRLVSQALEGKPLTVYGDGEQSRCFCNVRDTIRAVVALADEPKAIGEIFNVGSKEEVTIIELAERIRRQAGNDSPIVKIPYKEAYEEGFEDMRRRVPCIEKIRQAIGWKPSILLDETIGEIIAHFRSMSGAHASSL